MTGLRLDVEERARAWSIKAKGGTWMAKKYNMLNIKSLKSKKLAWDIPLPKLQS